LLVDLHADIASGGPLVPQNSPTSQMRFNIGRVLWHQIDQVLVTLAFPARIFHAALVIINYDQSSSILTMSSIGLQRGD
jgi:hypothetical protein